MITISSFLYIIQKLGNHGRYNVHSYVYFVFVFAMGIFLDMQRI